MIVWKDVRDLLRAAAIVPYNFPRPK
jgi:hypothetical protein